MNNASPPLDDVAVRQAIGYAIDRDAIVEQLFGPLGVEEPMQTLQPADPRRLRRHRGVVEVQLDLDKVDELMTGAGWEKNGDGIWAKGGRDRGHRGSRRRPETRAVS